MARLPVTGRERERERERESMTEIHRKKREGYPWKGEESRERNN